MTAPGWLLDEVAHAGPEHLDSGYVAAYDRKAGFDPTEGLQALLDLGLGANDTLVDLGAGTGTFALAAAPHCRRVVAVDPSPAMIVHLGREAARLQTGEVECVQAGFLTYAHEGEPADFVYSRHALHHLPDLWKVLALERTAAVLRPGGVLHLRDLVFSCAADEASSVIEAWLDGASPRPGVGWSRAELETHLRTEFSTFSWLLEPMLEEAGFRIERVHHDASRVHSTYTCAKRG